jgi:hypothetical protein
MRNVIVRPVVSYSVLVIGSLIALMFVWQAYEVITAIEQESRTQATEYQVAL